MVVDYYDRDGSPLTRDEWARKFTYEYKRVELTELGDGVVVSTVWLGMNHNWGEGAPLIFETLVMGGEFDEWMDRYATEEDARRGHAEVVAAIRNGGKLS